MSRNPQVTHPIGRESIPAGTIGGTIRFNDGAMSAVIETLLEAERLYDDAKYKQAAIRCGEFILRRSDAHAAGRLGAAVQRRHAPRMGPQV